MQYFNTFKDLAVEWGGDSGGLGLVGVAGGSFGALVMEAFGWLVSGGVGRNGRMVDGGGSG